MCWPRTWGQIFLPVLLSLFLVQLLISFSDNGFSQMYRKRKEEKQKRKTSIEEACTQKNSCQLCTEDKKCIWCNEEKVCKKFCFPFAGCPFNSIFWSNCKVDMFGIVMLILTGILLIAFLWYCCAYYHFIHEYRANIYSRGVTVPVNTWDVGGYEE
uniref:PTTG1IP family member 2 n=1 Tax=Ictidomys tridecemlineatus TaxID=43179 RepID=UPI001A9FD32B|nr:PTTG1IP family member 2 [Ictidomys tridecemlineatus]